MESSEFVELGFAVQPPAKHSNRSIFAPILIEGYLLWLLFP